jgi:hypothetical protein
MSTVTWKVFGKIISGDEICSWEIQQLISIFSSTVKDRVIKFSLMKYLYWGVRLGVEHVISGRHRKWKKKSKFSKIIFQIKAYTTLLGLFVQNHWPHLLLKRQLPFMFKKSFEFSILMPWIFLITKVFHLKLFFFENPWNT